MKKTAVLLYPQFSEYELSVALSILMQGNKPVITVGLGYGPIKGESGLTCLADTVIDEVKEDDIDSILLPGCLDVMTLVNEQLLFDFITRLSSESKIIGAISSSPFLLAKAGVLNGKNYTVGLSMEGISQLNVFDIEKYTEEVVVQDGNIITARGRGFIEFGIAFGKALNLEFNESWYKG